MKKYMPIAAVFLILLACMGQLKISQYPNTKTVADTDLLLISVPGITNRNITIADFRTNVIAQSRGDTYYISTSYTTNLYVTKEYVTNLYVTTNFNTYSYITNLIVYQTNIVNQTITTNLTVYQTNISNYQITTNQITYQTNIANYFITTNQITYQTNLSFFTITTNLIVYETNINNFTISTNLYAYNVWISNFFSTNIIVQNGLWQTNRTLTIASNSTSATLDFTGPKDWYDVPVLMETNLVLSPTNLIAGREIWVFFSADNCNYDVTITNSSGTAIYWNFNSLTNGTTSFTVTNGYKAELAIVCRTNNILHAVYGQYR